jgi:hypothetical protein
VKFGRTLLTGAAIVAFAAAATRAAFAGGDCAAGPGGRVILESDAVDPAVFLWDSRGRLADYAAGQWGNTHAIFVHTLLAEPGTQALVVSCVRDAAHPKFATGDEAAIGVKVVSGPYKGRFGWVLSSDIRLVRPNGESAVLDGAKN